MSETLATVQAMYEAFGRGDVPAVLEHLADDVEWEHDGVDHGVAWLHPGRGRDHVAGFFRALGELTITRFEPLNFLVGGNQVAVPIQFEAESSSTGNKIRELEMHLFTFGPDGKVSRFKHLVDTHQHVAAAQGG